MEVADSYPLQDFRGWDYKEDAERRRDAIIVAVVGVRIADDIDTDSSIMFNFVAQQNLLLSPNLLKLYPKPEVKQTFSMEEAKKASNRLSHFRMHDVYSSAIISLQIVRISSLIWISCQCM